MKRHSSRRARLASLSVLGALASVAIGCAGSDSAGDGAVSFSATPQAVLTTNEGHYQVEIRTAPDAAPTRGTNVLQLRVTDVASGAPAEGLDIAIVPWMPVMGHGASVRPTVNTTEAPGIYIADGVNLFMPGTWELRTALARGGSVEHATPSFQVP